MIQLQIRLSETLKSRFEKPLALAFTDVVNSTEYFSRFGNEAGRALQQRHLALIDEVIRPEEGRVVDVAGDGAFTVYPAVTNAVNAMIELQRRLTDRNLHYECAHRLSVRAGVHWGVVLTDGDIVTGKEVNLCARVAASAAAGEIRLTMSAFHELPNAERLRCAVLPPEQAKGFPDPIPLMRVDWHAGNTSVPVSVFFCETGQEIPLPDKETITFGRLHESSGQVANDIVLALPEAERTLRISRWHFELRRRPEGWWLRSLTDSSTEVDGLALCRGAETPIRAGSVVRVGQVLTLELRGKQMPDEAFPQDRDETMLPRDL
jgi:class 3 adenylate cyclase